METDQNTGLLCRCSDLLSGKKSCFPLLLFTGPNKNTESLKRNFKATAGEWKCVKKCFNCLKKCGALRGRDASLSCNMLGTLYKGPLVWTTEKMEVYRHLCLVSLGSSIKAFLRSVLSTEITPNVGLVLTVSEDPDETHSWPRCWTA